jgi:hypothetical protein
MVEVALKTLFQSKDGNAKGIPLLMWKDKCGVASRMVSMLQHHCTASIFSAI